MEESGSRICDEYQTFVCTDERYWLVGAVSTIVPARRSNSQVVVLFGLSCLDLLRVGLLPDRSNVGRWFGYSGIDRDGSLSRDRPPVSHLSADGVPAVVVYIDRLCLWPVAVLVQLGLSDATKVR